VRIALAPLGAVALSVRRDRIALSGVTLGAEEVRGLRSAIPGLLYQAAKHELSLRVPESRTAMEAPANLVARISEVRGRASLRPACRVRTAVGGVPGGPAPPTPVEVMRMNVRRPLLLLAAIGTASVLVACGGSSGGSSTSKASVPADSVAVV